MYNVSVSLRLLRCQPITLTPDLQLVLSLVFKHRI